MIGRPVWFPDWSGEVCAVIASGASVRQSDVEKLNGRCRVAVVNNNHELAPWADVLYAADGRWWNHYQQAQKFSGLKITPDSVVAKNCQLFSISLIGWVDTDDDLISVDRPGWIGRGGNSAFQLVNLVTQFGARRQIWLGFDFIGEHWHERHQPPLKNARPHTLDKWRKRLDAQASVFTGLGVDVVNVSEISALTAYRKMSLDEAFQRFGLSKQITSAA